MELVDKRTTQQFHEMTYTALDTKPAGVKVQDCGEKALYGPALFVLQGLEILNYSSRRRKDCGLGPLL
jgi:hypothetical protein